MHKRIYKIECFLTFFFAFLKYFHRLATTAFTPTKLVLDSASRCYLQLNAHLMSENVLYSKR